MSGEEKTVVFDGSLGTAVWEYIPDNKKAWGYFSASGVTENNTNPFDVTYVHVFFSKKLSDEENKKIISDLANVLKSVGAINIKADVKIITPVAQEINASYTIPNVPQDNVNSLSTTIASVSKGLINQLAGYPLPLMSRKK
jgi:ribosomal protein S17E